MSAWYTRTQTCCIREPRFDTSIIGTGAWPVIDRSCHERTARYPDSKNEKHAYVAALLVHRYSGYEARMHAKKCEQKPSG